MGEPRNLLWKLLDGRPSAGEIFPGEQVDLVADRILIEDATGSMTALRFETPGMDRQLPGVNPYSGFTLPSHTTTAGYPAIAAYLLGQQRRTA